MKQFVGLDIQTMMYIRQVIQSQNDLIEHTKVNKKQAWYKN